MRPPARGGRSPESDEAAEIRGGILTAYREVLGGKSASHALSERFRLHRGTPQIRSRVAAGLHRMIVSTEALLRLEGLEGAPDPRMARPLLQRFERMRARDPERVEALARRIPAWAHACLVERFGDRAGEMALALAAPAERTVRITRAGGEREAFAAQLAEQTGRPAEAGRWTERALRLPPWTDILSAEVYTSGGCELQDEASQVVAELVAPPPRGRVLDLCAGAGGKAVALADALEGRGEVLACDTSGRRLEAARKRARRLGLSQIRFCQLDAEAADWPEEVLTFARKADRILVDAPCSGLGAWRRRPELRLRVKEEELEGLQRLQRELLGRAAAVLAPGARVIYSTCTFRRQENEAVVEEVLAADPNLERVSVREVFGGQRADALGGAESLELDPLTHGTDGFFAATLRRKRG